MEGMQEGVAQVGRTKRHKVVAGGVQWKEGHVRGQREHREDGNIVSLEIKGEIGPLQKGAWIRGYAEEAPRTMQGGGTVVQRGCNLAAGGGPGRKH